MPDLSPGEKGLRIVRGLMLAAFILDVIGTVISLFNIRASLAAATSSIETTVVYASIIILIVFTVLLWMAYQGLKARDPKKGRILTLWLSIPMFLSIPVGTIFSIIIWVQLRKPEVKALFGISEPTAPSQPQAPQQQPPAQPLQ